MQRVLAGVAALLLAGVGGAQEPSGYPSKENPFGADYAFELGKPIQLHVNVEGVSFDSVTVVALQEVKAGTKVKCEVQFSGAGAAEKKATVTSVLLLEDATGKGLERLTLDTFKVKPGKPLDEKQRLSAGAESLSGATKVYVYIQVVY